MKIQSWFLIVITIISLFLLYISMNDMIIVENKIIKLNETYCSENADKFTVIHAKVIYSNLLNEFLLFKIYEVYTSVCTVNTKIELDPYKDRDGIFNYYATNIPFDIAKNESRLEPYETIKHHKDNEFHVKHTIYKHYLVKMRQ